MARDTRIDSLKGLLIILVVIGHVITTFDNSSTINHGVMGVIYIFHMPLFILISGYFSKSPEQQGQRQFWKSVMRLFLTVVLFHLLFCLRSFAINPDARHIFDGFPFCEAWSFFPFGELWYVLSLVYWKIAFYYTPRALRQRPVLYLAIALAISILSGLTHLGVFLTIQRALNFYLFFLLGYYYRHQLVNRQWWNNNVLHASIAVVLLPLIFWLYPRCGNFMNGADHYTLADIPQKALILTCSVAISILLFNTMRDFKWLRSIGRDSLFYYLYHFSIIVLLIEPMVMRFGLPCSFPFVLLYTAIIMVTLLLMSKIEFFRWLTHPYMPQFLKPSSRKASRKEERDNDNNR